MLSKHQSLLEEKQRVARLKVASQIKIASAILGERHAMLFKQLSFH
jgi:hypothetical protein